MLVLVPGASRTVCSNFLPENRLSTVWLPALTGIVAVCELQR